MTLKQFVKVCGGIEDAGAKLGVRGTTVWRWLNKKAVPQGNNARRLRELGVTVTCLLVASLFQGCATYTLGKVTRYADMTGQQTICWEPGKTLNKSVSLLATTVELVNGNQK